MKKITRQNLDELANEMPILSEKEQRGYWGGTGLDNPSNGGTGIYDPNGGSGMYNPNGGTGIIDPPIDGGTLSEVVVTGSHIKRPDNAPKQGDSSFSWYQTEHDYLYPPQTLTGFVTGEVTGIINPLPPGVTGFITGWCDNKSQVSYILSSANYPSGDVFGVWTDGAGQTHVCDKYGNILGEIDNMTDKVYIY